MYKHNQIVSNISPIPRLNTQVLKPTTTVHEDKVTNSSTLTTCGSDNVTSYSSSATSCANNQIVSNNISPIPRFNTANMGKPIQGSPTVDHLAIHLPLPTHVFHPTKCALLRLKLLASSPNYKK